MKDVKGKPMLKTPTPKIAVARAKVGFLCVTFAVSAALVARDAPVRPAGAVAAGRVENLLAGMDLQAARLLLNHPENCIAEWGTSQAGFNALYQRNGAWLHLHIRQIGKRYFVTRWELQPERTAIRE